MEDIYNRPTDLFFTRGSFDVNSHMLSEKKKVLRIVKYRGDNLMVCEDGWSWDKRDFDLVQIDLENALLDLCINSLEEDNISLPSLDYTVDLCPRYMEVGCQTIDREDAIELAVKILDYYEVKP